jgi:tRNA1(Val) A37 N6-methylase TrmN6
LDCGAGVGTVGLCVARRLPVVRVVMVERATEMVVLARENVARNELSARAEVVEADLTAPLTRSAELVSLSGSFDHVLANPPYFVDANGTRSTDGLKDAANTMPAGSLDDWARFMAAMTRPGGMATVIHRVEALAELLEVMGKRFGGLLVLPVQPRSREAANRVIVRGVKGSRAPLTLLPALVIHGDDGHGYRPEIEAVLRGPAGLAMRR